MLLWRLSLLLMLSMMLLMLLLLLLLLLVVVMVSRVYRYHGVETMVIVPRHGLDSLPACLQGSDGTDCNRWSSSSSTTSSTTTSSLVIRLGCLSGGVTVS